MPLATLSWVGLVLGLLAGCASAPDRPAASSYACMAAARQQRTFVSCLRI